MMRLRRYEGNPIISPRSNNPWDCNGAFNPAAVKIGRKVYIVYRAISKNNISTFMLATSEDGFTIDERLEDPIYIPREDFEVHPAARGKEIDPKKPLKIKIRRWMLLSGGGYFGCEDPRITRIGNRVYMTYVAFNGASWIMRTAITSIKVKDFKEGNWEWEKPKVITHPGIPEKCVVLFPEKINGSYMFLHRPYPNIWADYVDDLKFENGRFIWGKPIIKVRPWAWDSRKIGAGAPPVEASFGWILVYNGVSGWDPVFDGLGFNRELFKCYDPHYRYKVGILVLNKKNPEEIILRPYQPALEPQEWYEGRICYSTGAVIRKGKLIVYYGGNDKYVCAAEIGLDEIKEAVLEREGHAEEVYWESGIIPFFRKILGERCSIQSMRCRAW